MCKCAGWLFALTKVRSVSICFHAKLWSTLVFYGSKVILGQILIWAMFPNPKSNDKLDKPNRFELCSSVPSFGGFRIGFLDRIFSMAASNISLSQLEMPKGMLCPIGTSAETKREQSLITAGLTQIRWRTARFCSICGIFQAGVRSVNLLPVFFLEEIVWASVFSMDNLASKPHNAYCSWKIPCTHFSTDYLQEFSLCPI